jgi:hypothetical protein
MYQTQLRKISNILPSLHEDLQYDYAREIENLSYFLK